MHVPFCKYYHEATHLCVLKTNSHCGLYKDVKPALIILTQINPLYTGNSYWGTFANIKDPDEMPHFAAFRLGLHCLLQIKTEFRDRST